MGIINILDTQTANMIAAGEVVERPASAVKEMIENSIDAGATHIICEIRGGGNSYIRITDDGKGISGDDLPKAILPHATSKIMTAEDLDGVLTLGFRGEALAAISSVSRLEILSKQKSDSVGHKLTCDENGVEVSEEGSPDGTVITVRDLFYNVPARRKFMRKDATEASAISGVLAKAALAHPEISFKMISEGAVKFITPGDGDLYSAIYATLGKDFATSLTTVTGVYSGITVGGYISKPGETRGSRSGQYFFVNGRPIQSTQIMAALEQAFRSYMPQKRFPAAILKLDVPPKSIDVNVHPAKTEIKFSDDRKIFEAIYSSVLNSLKGEDITFISEESKTSSVFSSTENPVATPSSNNVSKDDFSKSGVSSPKNSFSGRDSFAPSQNRFSKDSPQKTAENVFSHNDNPNTLKDDFYSLYTQSSQNTSSESFDLAKKSSPLFDDTKKQTDSYILLRDPNVPLKESFDDMVKKAERNKLSPTSEQKPEDSETFLSIVYDEDTSKTDPSIEEKHSANSESHIFPEASINTSIKATEGEQTSIMESDLLSEDRLRLSFKVVGEIFGGYILAETDDNLLIVDKHAAHERIIYEDLARKRTDAHSQILLSPHIIRLGYESTELLLENKELLLSYGFEIDTFGNDSIAVRAIPSTLTGIKNVEPLLEEFATSLSHGDRLPFTKRCDRALYTLACKAAIKLGAPSGIEELSSLVEQLLSDPNLRLCPHGRPIIKEMPKREIEKFFDR